MAKVKFLSGNMANLPEEVVDGQVYFAITDEEGHTGQILFDKGQNRYVMSSSSTNSVLATCLTESNTPEKEIKITSDNVWSLSKGQTFFVLFSETNKAVIPSFTIKKNGKILGRKIPIYYKDRQIMNQELDKGGSENYILEYIYDGTNFRYVAGFGDESKGRFYNSTPKTYRVGETAIESNTFVSMDENGNLVPAAKKSFMVGAPFYVNGVELDEIERGENAELFDRHYCIQIILNGSEINGIPYKPLYLVGQIQGKTFIPDNEPIAYSLLNDNKCYLYIGEISNLKSSNGNYCYLNFNTNHPIYQNNSIYSPTTQVNKLNHTLTIGDIKFDGSKDETVLIYDGFYDQN